MSLTTNLAGRLRNTPLPRTHALLPLFEAVVNSIHACENEAGSATEGRSITVHILREPKETPQVDLLNDEPRKAGVEALPEIKGFTIIDNGVGFNDANMESFKTLDSDYKEQKGCRGVGRLLWLKAFKTVEVLSRYAEPNGSMRQRNFSFSKEGVMPSAPEGKPTTATTTQTTVSMSEFYPAYRKYAPKTIHKISELLLEHCLWYFIREGGRPQIKLIDGDESVELDALFDSYTLGNIEYDFASIGSHRFELTYIKARNPSLSNHEICYCAASRLVKKVNITNKIPGLYKRIADQYGAFAYMCFVTSPFLDERVRSERTGFEIEDSRSEGDQGSLFNATVGVIDNEIVFDDIDKVVLGKISEKIGDTLATSQQTGRQRVEVFVDNTAPKYKSIMRHYPNFSVDPDTTDKELDILLYKKLSELEVEVISKGHELSTPKENEPFDDYSERLNDYLAKVNDIKMADLANYVFHRKVVLDFFEEIIQRHRDGKYSQENIVHRLIMPMQVESDEIKLENANLWLIDERLAFHNYLASDKSLKVMPITESEETVRPDIVSLGVYDNPLLVNNGKQLPLASITVIEIKRPMRNDFSEGEEDNPIEQALAYVKKIRAGGTKTKDGRAIPQSASIPAFCYILADLTPTMETRAQNAALTVTSDHMGYFGYNPSHNAYIEVIGFDRLITAAKERNKAFFDKLGLPSN